jgi:hypothetical protein
VRRPTPPRAIEPPPANLNLDLGRVAMDNYCNFHQASHSEKTFPQWINAMNLVTNRLLDECAQVEGYGEQSRGKLEEASFEHSC